MATEPKSEIDTTRLAAAAPEMYRALKAVEWQGTVEYDADAGRGYACCPDCRAPTPDVLASAFIRATKAPGVHESWCELAAALRKAEGG